VSTAQILPTDDHVLAEGRIMEVLSEQCAGWLEGYLLTGRHDSFPAMRHSSTLSIRCSTSTEVAQDHRALFRGGALSPR